MIIFVTLLCLLDFPALVELSVTNSLRELAGGAFLSSWPSPARQLVRDKVEMSIKYANNIDQEDCAKKMLCQLAGKRRTIGGNSLSWDEQLLINAFDVDAIDYASSSVQFNVAVQVGKKEANNCPEVYSRCNLNLEEMLKTLRRQGISFEIPGDEKDCAVYFLWKNKGIETNETISNEVQQTENNNNE